MPVDIARLFGSEFHARSSDAGWRAGFTLWLRSYHQVPAASVPDDDVALARLAELGRDVKAWRKIRAEALYGWVRCSDGRLYHPVVAEKALEGWIAKLVQNKSSQAGNAKRYGYTFDAHLIELKIDDSRRRLAVLNPQSKVLAKRTSGTATGTPGDLPPGGVNAPGGTPTRSGVDEGPEQPSNVGISRKDVAKPALFQNGFSVDERGAQSKPGASEPKIERNQRNDLPGGSSTGTATGTPGDLPDGSQETGTGNIRIESPSLRSEDSFCPKPVKPVRTRKPYSADFEAFWTAYPTDSLMSKQDAGKAWGRLGPEDRMATAAAVPGFAAYCRAHPDYRPLHAVRFLTQRRFDGDGKRTAGDRQGDGVALDGAGLIVEDRGGSAPGRPTPRPTSGVASALAGIDAYFREDRS